MTFIPYCLILPNKVILEITKGQISQFDLSIKKNRVSVVDLRKPIKQDQQQVFRQEALPPPGPTNEHGKVVRLNVL